MEKICNVKPNSKIRFELDGKTLTGHNWRDARDVNKVYVSERGPNRTVELPADKEVEILEQGGFQSEISVVEMR